MAKDLNLTVNDLIANKEKTALIKQKLHYTRNRFIRIERYYKELEKPGLDPRKSAKVFEFDSNVKR
jgi:uncharacterized protein